MKRAATFDSSFWVHAVYLDLVDFLLSDFELVCTKAVERELGRDNPTSLRLRALLADGSVNQAAPKSEKIRLYGDGERAAINLALERKLLLLIVATITARSSLRWPTMICSSRSIASSSASSVASSAAS